MNLGPLMAKIKVDKEKAILAQKAQKRPLESVKMKNSIIVGPEGTKIPNFMKVGHLVTDTHTHTDKIHVL